MNIDGIPMPVKSLLLIISCILIFFPLSLIAADKQSDEKIGLFASETEENAVPIASDRNIRILEPVVVTAPRVPSEIDRVPAAVGIVEKEDIQMGQPTVNLDEGLERVPGVFVQNRYNFAQDVRISIRGFGARAAFGIRGIQIYVDGIPVTLPDGQSQVDIIDPDSIERIEVMRGPVSALYGNASGGMINITTGEGDETPFSEVRTVNGEFGFRKTNFKSGGRTGPMNYFFNFSRMEIDGFRDHGEAEAWTMNGKLRYDMDEVSDLTFVTNAVYSPKLKDPGGLTREQVEADPEQAAPLSLEFDTGEKVSDGRLGLVYRRSLTPRRNIEAALYYSSRDLENAIPFRFIKLDRQVLGGRFQYDFSSEIEGITHQLFTGIDVQHQNDERLNFENEGGDPGDTLLLSQDEDVTSVGLYLQEEVLLTSKWSAILGARYDYIRFEIDDHLVIDGDDTGSKTFDQATGRFGLMYRPRPGIQVYANIAESFETPTTTELVNRPEGGGGINPDLEPQKSVNYEIGLKGLIGPRLSYDAAIFYISIEDELIAFRDITDRVFYRNAGESRRTGAELGLTLKIVKGLEMNLAYTYLHAEFEAFKKDGVNLEGNEVPGIPKHLVFGEIVYRHPSGFYAGIDTRLTGEFYADDENSVENDDYIVTDIRTGFRKRMEKWRIEPFFGIQNLFNENYMNNVRINARGNRFFEPAPGFNIYAGIGLGYQW